MEKGHRKGSWVLRRKVTRGTYEVQTIGEADDGAARPDGSTILTFRQAQEKARIVADAIARSIRASVDGPVPTVRGAVDDYLKTREARERARKGEGAGLRRDARSRLTRHVLDADEALSAKPLRRAYLRRSLQVAQREDKPRREFGFGASSMIFGRR